MKIFLSYPSARKDTAASIHYELQTAGHDVFFDKEDLPPGQSYNERIRAAIEACDLVIFLITPQSVAQGHYTLTELKIAGRKWPSPNGHVLPVMLEGTPFDSIPAYLKAVTILTPQGNIAAEILIEIGDLAAALPVKAKPQVTGDSEVESFSYRPVEIRFGRGSAGSYPMAITASPAGSLAAQPCPLDAEALANQLWSEAVPSEETPRRGNIAADARLLMPSEKDARRAGEMLYRSLFGQQIEAFLKVSLESVDPQRREGLRFLINTTDAPDLARLPWEFLYNPEQDDFLFSDRMKPIIRWLDVDQPPPQLIVEPPLRLLMAVAAPQDRPELSVGAELAHLDDALRDLVDQGRVSTTRLEHATLEKLDDALLAHKPHMLHFIGHGDFVGNDGVILLEAEKTGAADPITGRRLAVLLRNHLGSLRFVFLNSCLGAAASLRDPFGGVAQNLIRRGIPAVIAMQFPIPDAAAVALARHFYRYLAAAQPVDTALTSARAFLYARGYPVEWGAPSLHMRTPDGRLFDVGTTRQSPTPSAAVAPPPRVPGDEARAAAESYAPVKSALPRRRLWVVAGIFLACIASAGLFLFYPENPQRAPEQTGIPPTNSAPIGSSPAQANAEKRYRNALQALSKGDTQSALGEVAEAQSADRDGAVLAGLPDLRAKLFAGLFASTQKALAEKNNTLAGRAAGALMSIDKPRASRELKKIFPTAAGRPVTAASESYRVRNGDTLWAIAAAQWGDPTRWPQIYQANREAIKSPALIYPDQQLRIPAGSTPPAPVRYRVNNGDTLWSIAGAFYGDPTLWRAIYEANRDLIENPETIAPGQKFLIPPRGANSEPSA